MTEEKTCFVISPIGEDNSEARKRADDVLNYIIKPVATKFDYEVKRADEISEPGMISFQIIEHLVNDPLVIADCTNHKANVFYELAVRHAAKKPVIQMIKRGQNIPFDVSDMRTVMISRDSLGEAEKCKQELGEQIKAIEEGSEDKSTNSPVSSAIELNSLRESGSPADRQFEKIMSKLERIGGKISQINPQKLSVSDREFLEETLSGQVPADKGGSEFPGEEISFTIEGSERDS